MALERFVDFLTGASEVKRDREKGRVLADRFDSIKPKLKKLRVQVTNSGCRYGNDWITTITLRTSGKKAERVAGLLESAGIKVVSNGLSKHEKTKVAVELVEKGLLDGKGLEKYLDERSFVIFDNKYTHINNEDLSRLLTLEPKVEHLARLI